MERICLAGGRRGFGGTLRLIIDDWDPKEVHLEKRFRGHHR